ncbi:NtaA/DmoA family FMN-dependent monooxygenase [Paenibacillus sp. 2TAB23]|uniref:NtaA/DmoA family FMN-dependent monooxygenase n=1 Tax=Paenibacillus sp. 2TAB23 TaxID=3233004 RepID=UPI003F978D9B
MKKIHIGIFDIQTPNQMTQGAWAHPENQSTRYKDLSFWIEIAQLCERGLFDFIFFADSYGYPTNKHELAYREAVYTPVLDPMLSISALSAVTKHLAFISTASPTYEAPYANARRFSTLDHLTNGRIGWNVVAAGGNAGAACFGRDATLSHDERYDQAEEFLEISYRLFEESWEDEAVLANREQRRYADYSKVKLISHEGKYFNVTASHACEPSIQRTPVLFQAGSSDRGRDFAAKHAEGVFLKAPTMDALKKQVEDIRRRAVSYGRQADDIKIFTGLSAIVGETTEQAIEKLESFKAYRSREAALLTYENATGIDLTALDPESAFGDFNSEQGRTHTERFTKHQEKTLTVREVADQFAEKEFRGITLCGDAATIVDQMQQWVEHTGIDGFNLERYLLPGTITDFVDYVVPELQRRSMFRTAYEEESLRERLFGAGKTKLPHTHPGAHFRKKDSE